MTQTKSIALQICEEFHKLEFKSALQMSEDAIAILNKYDDKVVGRIPTAEIEHDADLVLLFNDDSVIEIVWRKLTKGIFEYRDGMQIPVNRTLN